MIDPCARLHDEPRAEACQAVQVNPSRVESGEHSNNDVLQIDHFLVVVVVVRNMKGQTTDNNLFFLQIRC